MAASMKFSCLLRLSVAATVLAAPLAVQAQETGVQAKASGEVRRVDTQNQKIAVKHGDIPELSLTAMTLVYRVSPELLGRVSAGDKIRFTATRKDDQYWIIEIDR